MKRKSPDASDDHLENVDWENLQSQINLYVKSLVGRSNHPRWRGQQNDVVKDISGETIMKLWMRTIKAKQGKAPAIDSLNSYGKVVAYRCFIDELRKNRHLRWPQLEKDDPYEFGIGVAPNDATLDPAELAIENLSNERILSGIAVEIVHIPYKRQNALLTDLAWLCAFDEVVTPLPRILLTFDIRLQDYRVQPSRDPVLRSRHASLLTLAYKHLATWYAARLAD